MAAQDKYCFERDKKESERLDSQHRVLVRISGDTLIHPSIPIEDIRSVADIATGTGIWLRDLKRSLDTPQVDRYYHGFDISSEQFPDNPGAIQFSVHDLTVPFPQEHWGRYDLVHVRLLVAALEEPDYKAAIANISRILKPGGYLQWEEIDAETYLTQGYPVLSELYRCFDYGLTAEGKCFQASAKVYEETRAAKFVGVERLCYDSHKIPDLRYDVEERLAAIIRTLYVFLLLRSKQVDTAEVASQEAENLAQEHRRRCAEGNSPPLKLMRVVGQKPLHRASL
ncbi:class I SAM-dependent methyltransferase [Aspergillus neoniger CBS 115656]|uniref:LaeA-like methyltransferase n=1 Tax=Aspergillus neoniger (strain CBS 115656) TaxID=1448310 RepID=A0A318YVR3_ASPNB|nr:LaeA-like methyltransferase [Aspergillus neoniger CBS 115656]PYH38097.1 LaeA-like methyltransferase [Aspergillus neoniger CBS 115656]